MGSTRTLSNREAVRLLRDWGFVPIKTRGKHAGGHLMLAWQNEDGSRISVTAPGRKTPTPPAAYRKAAELIGITVAELLDGPAEYVKNKGEAALIDLHTSPEAKKRGRFMGTDVDMELPDVISNSGNDTSPDITEEGEQIMTSHRTGMVQTCQAEYAERVKRVLEVAESPLAIGTVRDLSGGSERRGENVVAAIDYLNEHGVAVASEYRRTKGGRAFKVFYMLGTDADPLVKMLRAQAEKEKEETVAEVKAEVAEVTEEVEVTVEEIKQEAAMTSKQSAALAKANADRHREAEDRILAAVEFIQSRKESVLVGEVAAALGINRFQAGALCRQARGMGLMFARTVTKAEHNGNSGRRPLVYDTVLPIRRRRSTVPVAESVEDIREKFQKEEIKVEHIEVEVPGHVEITQPPVEVEPDLTIMKVKPNGDLVLIDSDGEFYLARKVEI